MKIPFVHNGRGLSGEFAKFPSLKASLADSDWQADAWDDAADDAIKETGMARKVFTKSCPWSKEQIMDHDFILIENSMHALHGEPQRVTRRGHKIVPPTCLQCP